MMTERYLGISDNEDDMRDIIEFSVLGGRLGKGREGREREISDDKLTYIKLKILNHVLSPFDNRHCN